MGSLFSVTQRQINILTGLSYIPILNIIAAIGFYLAARDLDKSDLNLNISEATRQQGIKDLRISAGLALFWLPSVLVFSIESIAKNCFDASVFSTNAS